MKRIINLILVAFMFGQVVFAQTGDLKTVKPGRFDQGKMWTFENPPVKYFEEAYGFTPTDEWMADVRKSALRFASWCSASFVSESGLIMTNHHCSRGVVASVMNDGENFDDNGFYAESLEAERKVPDLYVDQLVLVADITTEVKALKDQTPEAALEEVTNKYKTNADWKDLVIESRTFYSGGKYSLYGFKRYNDIRLVLYPEVPLGYFGGDPDNFTFPRYSLDFTFFRAYDDNGQPLKPSNFFEFNPAGADESEAVFVVGNPGSTGRYLTMAQLYFQRDVSVPAVLSLLSNKKEILLKAAESITDVYKKDSVVNLAFSLSNSEKAYTGRLDGLRNEYLMAKKELKEKEVRSNAAKETNDPWVGLEESSKESAKYYAETVFLSPNSLRGSVNSILHKLYDYRLALENENTEAAEAQKADIMSIMSAMDTNLERALFASLLSELSEHSRQGYIAALLDGKAPFEKASELMKESIVLNDAEKFFDMKAKKLDKEPLIAVANQLVPRYREASGKVSAINKGNKDLEAQIMNKQFQLSGISSPPDATFSLRIADGVVKGYEYNGTTAPFKTTYFGLYDRYYSNDGKFPWNLPDRWLNPSMELLKSPMNFVCTADIIGGNSGSPVINTKGEVIGLAFDGNIESLPGYFIFDDTLNRTVCVHSGGIVAAVKYIYKAERLLPELNAK